MGVVSTEEALRMAEEQGLDLLAVSEDTVPPVCKIVDFGHFKYEQQKKEKLSKKGSKNQSTKELKFSPKISDHDYQTRLSHGRKFLEKGHKIKMTIFFKGREFHHPELGIGIANRYLEDTKDLGLAESRPSFVTSRQLVVVINPKR